MSPPASCVDIRGFGVLLRHPQASFNLGIRGDVETKTFTGSLTYQDLGAALQFSSTNINGITVMGNRATIVGSGLANGVAVTFLAMARHAVPDTFSLRLSSGYSVEDSVTNGQIRVRNRC